MPVLLAGRDPSGVAGPDLAHRTAPGLHPPNVRTSSVEAVAHPKTAVIRASASCLKPSTGCTPA
jgi:hypothetical protein